MRSSNSIRASNF